MFEVLAPYVGGVLVGAIVTRAPHKRRTSGSQLAETEIDIANVAFIHAARDELPDDQLETLGHRANEYCDEWDVPVEFDVSEVSDQ